MLHCGCLLGLAPALPTLIWIFVGNLDVFSVLVVTLKVSISTGKVLIIRWRVEGEVVVRSVQFCVFTCPVTPRWKKPALPLCSPMCRPAVSPTTLMPPALMAFQEGWIKGRASQKKMLNPKVTIFTHSASHQIELTA